MSDLSFGFCVFRLKQCARIELKSLGNSVIQNLGFRDIWYFIGQKGIKDIASLKRYVIFGNKSWRGDTNVTCFILLMDFIHNQHCKILEIKAKLNKICREGHISTFNDH